MSNDDKIVNFLDKKARRDIVVYADKFEKIYDKLWDMLPDDNEPLTVISRAFVTGLKAMGRIWKIGTILNYTEDDEVGKLTHGIDVSTLGLTETKPTDIFKLTVTKCDIYPKTEPTDHSLKDFVLSLSGPEEMDFTFIYPLGGVINVIMDYSDCFIPKSDNIMSGDIRSFKIYAGGHVFDFEVCAKDVGEFLLNLENEIGLRK